MTKSLLIASGLALAAGTAASALTYSNGPLSTGATSSGGAAAPAGSTWSEVQLGNTIAGFGAQTSANNRMADDFVVGAGGWNVTAIRFFSYQTGGGTVTPTITGVNFRIGTGAGTGTVFGDTTTNRLTSSTFANIFRIFNNTPGTTRPIWNVDAGNLNGGAGVNLAAGTYFLDWNFAGSLASGPWAPSVTIPGQVTQPGWNGLQSIAGGPFNPALDGVNVQDLAFEITYTVIPTPGAAAILGLAGLAGIRRRR